MLIDLIFWTCCIFLCVVCFMLEYRFSVMLPRGEAPQPQPPPPRDGRGFGGHSYRRGRMRARMVEGEEGGKFGFNSPGLNRFGPDLPSFFFTSWSWVKTYSVRLSPSISFSDLILPEFAHNHECTSYMFCTEDTYPVFEKAL
ncbi:hypothetical protein L249_5025, partial [Ophiocordyceps polyrhachis-furcata BCC 54312]